MVLSLVTAPAFEPLSRAEAKLHCKVDATADDALIDALILAARQHVETFTHRALVAQTWDVKLDTFPWAESAYYGEIWLPKPPVLSVTSVSYIDSDGVTQTWGTSNYTADLPAGPWARKGRIYPAYTVSYPTVRRVYNAVTVRIVCGYGGATVKTVSGIQRSSSTATATTSADHGWTVGQRVTIKGSGQDDYNGTFEILTVPTAATFTFTVYNSPTATATGTMSAAVLDVPTPIVAAMKILVAHWYDTGRVAVGETASSVPQTIDALLWPFKAF